MKLYIKLLISVFLVILAAGLTGCIEKTIFPAANFSVVKVTPDSLRLASDTKIIFPGTVITLSSDTSIPADMEAFAINYTTRLGEPIPQIAVPETPFNQKLAPAATTDIALSPYSNRLYALFSHTVADISPVIAYITINIKDVNNNKIQVQASCLCYAPWDETSN